MLGVVPFRGAYACGQGEVAIGPKPPKDAAVAGAILILDLDDPMLMAHGKQEVAVVGRIDDRIGVSPVGKAEGVAVHGEMIERGPRQFPVLHRSSLPSGRLREAFPSCRHERIAPRNAKLVQPSP